MSDDAAQETDEGEEDQFRVMRQKANAHDAAEKRAAEAERKLAFVEAGVPLDDKTTYFVKGYDGEITAEAIRAEAQRIGVITTESQVTPQENEGLRQMAQASAGAPPSGDNSWHEDMDAIDPNDPRASEKIYAVQVKHGRWPPREF
jgi:hypothetical protein